MHACRSQPAWQHCQQSLYLQGFHTERRKEKGMSPSTYIAEVSPHLNICTEKLQTQHNIHSQKYQHIMSFLTFNKSMFLYKNSSKSGCPSTAVFNGGCTSNLGLSSYGVMYNFVAKQKLLYETLQVSLFPVPPFLYQSTLLVINR